MSSMNPWGELIKPKSEYEEKDEKGNVIKKANSMDMLKSKSQAAFDVVSNLTGAFKDMFDALGQDEAADTMQFISDLGNSLNDIAQGIASKNPVQVISGIVKGITAIAANHDRKLDRAIKKSQLEVKKLGNEYSELQRLVSRQLGAVTTGQAKQMLENQKRQIEELQNQRAAEIDKKKTNWDTVTDIEGRINEARDKLRYFYEDLAKEQFGIDFKKWGAGITDAIVDAFAKGEDAIDAFDSSVADMMKSVINSFIKLHVIEPAMDKLRNYLFGRYGVFTDGDLSESDIAGMGRYFRELKDKIGGAKDIWDNINKMWEKEYGESLNSSLEKDTLSKGIQALTEDTGHLLGSYINAIRANSSKQLLYVERMVVMMEMNNNTFALQLATLKQIESNTARSADGTESILSLLKNLTLSGSGLKMNV